ncbi:Tetratricopeptide repeat-containing protein [Hymenobacter daecheongensis DSM 21074]|uniref:Tetratricopeptide repeat-containing protein n=1 Tax=Hymenobacter daecheongensis DSM 21074 TaxID=1121955 RepID=A0A1M6B8I9_9BACT|nr:tetratricopeptide repeat protein [Hymenobacter daecheongensis]SHI44967.1 Tetratricopeptide repeat-containing protein [Hymenobacter daecheongensis DSM 21074]
MRPIFPTRFRTYRLALLLSCGLLGATPLHAQEEGGGIALAQEYARKGENEKAAFLFGRLRAEEQLAANVLPDYLLVLQNLKRYKDAEKLVKKGIRQHPEEVGYGVALGSLYLAAADQASADKQFERVVSQASAEQILAVAVEFNRRKLPQWAEKTYLRGRALAKSETEFAPQLIQLYTQDGQTDKVMDETLRLVQQDEQQLPFVRNMLQNSLREDKDFDALERILITNVQKYPERAVNSELLLWLQVQRHDFGGALVQAKALDRRSRTEGMRVIELAAIAQRNKDYETAISGYEYVTQQYRGGQYYGLARQRLVQAREEQVRSTYPVDPAKIRGLIGEYQNVLTELGKTPETAGMLRNMAALYAFQLDEKDRAMTLLQEVIAMPRAGLDVVDDAKINLADIYLLRNEPWEATLLYSQVEKSHKDSPVGYEAKLRNARLSYYAGDFKLAKSHLDILKEATSREIANDAMQLSLLITDNTAMDTSGVALRDYSKVELLVFQNRLPEAVRGLDNLLQKYPGHALSDDAWYLKAQLQRRMGNYQEALTTLQRITANPKYDVLSDDALFLTASILEENLQDRDKAKELYNQMLTKYPGSIYVAEARKRFRKLRGDVVN